MSQATALEQLMLELVNAERAKVGAQPLTFNSNLNASADGHSGWMISTDAFSHTGSSGSTPTDRMKAAGYGFSGTWASAENIAWVSTREPAGLQDEIQLLHTNLMNSPGHKANILNGSFKEIGIGFDTGAYQSWEGAFVTQNFAVSGTKTFLTGVATNDHDGDRAYDIGEGLGGITVTAVSASGVQYTATTQAAGGYSLALAAGTYTVTFSGGGVAPVTQQVTIGAQNVKLDFSASGAVTTPTPTPVEPTPVATIAGTADRNTLTGTSSTDTMNGYGGNDRLYGKGSADKLYGGTGNDRVVGDSGNDRLFGGDGRDALFGGTGRDVLKGGSGADTFCFRGNWGADQVSDFRNGSDRIDLRGNDLSFRDLSFFQRDADRDGKVDDVVIKADGQSITLLNMKMAYIGASDFLF